MKKTTIAAFLLLSLLPGFPCAALGEQRNYILKLDSKLVNGGSFDWTMKRDSDTEWLPAVVPGTVLTSLVEDGICPEPYFGLNNKLEKGIIPDLSGAGRDFYTYRYRTVFTLAPSEVEGKNVWLEFCGVNYRSEVWLNGRLLGCTAGMFREHLFEISGSLSKDGSNTLEVKVFPVDIPGRAKPKGNKRFGAEGEFRNGGDGEIGANVTQLMTVGWDFTFNDGIRDRNTGIWRSVRIFTTGEARLSSTFVKSSLAHPSYDACDETVSVDLCYSGTRTRAFLVKGEIEGEGISFEKTVYACRGQEQTVTFSTKEFPQLHMASPRLWWPRGKGAPELYTLSLKVYDNGVLSDSVRTRFGIREVMSDTDTPDGSRRFIVNGRPFFVKGSNWMPEAMLRGGDERIYAQLRYTAQSGIDFLRLWGGGIAESDYFFDLCDEFGILVWTEFWMTGDTRHPADRDLYLSNVASTVKRLRNHPSLAYYVASNESTEVSGTKELIRSLDPTRGYQMQSECDGIHDGSPYKQVNPMSHYEDKASERGSRICGFNPEYGAPCLPVVENLRRMMPESALWPIDREIWDYLDGGGFHRMSTLYADMVGQYGECDGIEDFARKAQLVGALNYKSIFEVWNYNRFGYGDRWTSGFLYWYHNNPNPQVAARMWDWYLEPTAALYAVQNANEPVHPQFDFLKNTVSVVNNTTDEHRQCTIVAEVYDTDMRKTYSADLVFNIVDDEVLNDILTLDFSRSRTSVQFIRLVVKDARGKQLGSNLYWRSNSEYKGADTLTGPCTAEFAGLAKLARTSLKTVCRSSRDEEWQTVTVELRNTGKTLSFFTRIQLVDSSGACVSPSYYSDNFFSLMTGEKKTVSIRTKVSHLPSGGCRIKIGAFNSKTTISTL